MKIKIKKLHPDAVIPSYAKKGDAAMDLTAVEVNRGDGYIQYKTGLAIEIPEGFFGLIRPRSSVSTKDLVFSTSGVIDSGYRGDLMVRFKINTQPNKVADIYKTGERVCQLLILPYPPIELEEVDELTETERGAGGYGSTGK